MTFQTEQLQNPLMPPLYTEEETGNPHGARRCLRRQKAAHPRKLCGTVRRVGSWGGWVQHWPGSGEEEERNAGVRELQNTFAVFGEASRFASRRFPVCKGKKQRARLICQFLV